MEQSRGHNDEERAYYSLSERVYRHLAPFYDAVTWPAISLRQEVVALAAPERAAKVLDVATGTGAQARAFARRAAEVVGVDLSEAMLEVARRKSELPNLTFVPGDAAELPFPDAVFDVACISFALHEMPRTIRERVLAEMVRVTKPHGTIVVVDYGLPPGKVTSWLVFHAVKLYERDTYTAFIRSDLGSELARAGIGGVRASSKVIGAVRIWIGSPQEAPVPKHGLEVGDASTQRAA